MKTLNTLFIAAALLFSTQAFAGKMNGDCAHAPKSDRNSNTTYKVADSKINSNNIPIKSRSTRQKSTN